MSLCTICDAKHYAKGYCHRHYQRLRKHGDANTTLRGSARAQAVRLILGELEDDWKKHAACRNHPRPDIFYPPPARADDPDDDVDLSNVNRSKRERRRRIIVAEAKSVCYGCPVRARQLGGTGQCLDFADAIGDFNGIWGGLTARERGRKRDER